MPETVRFVELSVAMEPDVAWKLPVKSAVPVASTQFKLVTPPRVPTFNAVIVPLVAWKLVANNAVLVVSMPATLSQLRELNVPVPAFKVVMVPLVPVSDVNARPVVVTLFAKTFPSVDVPVTFNVPVAVRFNVVMPPSR